MTWFAIVVIGLLLEGCADRLLFVEESHLGLKAKVSTNSPSPYELDIGYRRGLFALVPARTTTVSPSTPGPRHAADSPAPPMPTAQPPDHQPPVRLAYDDDPEELVSMYVSFKGNIGFNDPIRVCHFLATGIAATTLAAKPDASKTLNLGDNCFKNADAD